MHDCLYDVKSVTYHKIGPGLSATIITLSNAKTISASVSFAERGSVQLPYVLQRWQLLPCPSGFSCINKLGKVIMKQMMHLTFYWMLRSEAAV